jgi:hypothetical protein
VELIKSEVLTRLVKRNPSENRSPNLKFLWHFIRYQSTYDQIALIQRSLLWLVDANLLRISWAFFVIGGEQFLIVNECVFRKLPQVYEIASNEGAGCRSSECRSSSQWNPEPSGWSLSSRIWRSLSLLYLYFGWSTLLGHLQDTNKGWFQEFESWGHIWVQRLGSFDRNAWVRL